MKRVVLLALFALFCCCAVWAQDPAIAPLQTLPINPPEKHQDASQDTSATSGDQITKPAGAKGSTLVGCLSGPDKDGKFTLRSMHYRMGVQVLGGDDLKNDSGSKVKLTGQWEAPTSPQTDANSTAAMRRFQVTQVEVLGQKCSSPSETTPTSKTKKQNPTTYNAPGDDSSH